MAGLLILLLLLGIALCSTAGFGIDSRDPSFGLWPLKSTDLADVTDTQTRTAGRRRAAQRPPANVANVAGAYGTWVSTLAFRHGNRPLPHHQRR